jgi:6-phosphogluconolactonase
MRTRRLEVFPNENAVARRAAALARDLAREVIPANGRFTIALSGGSTPRLFHHELVAMREHFDWKRTHLFYSDERAVPPDHEHSNHRMAKQTLIDALHIPPENVHRVMADDGDAVRAAREYEQELLAVTGDGTVDLCMLGMGNDGHTASLFPGREPPAGGLVVATTAPPESPIEQRVTFTYRAIEQARAVLIMVVGAGKAERLAEILDGPGDLPLRKVIDARGSDTLLLVDEAAAAQLSEETRNG